MFFTSRAWTAPQPEEQMLKMKGMACIEAPLRETWEVLSNLEKLSDWSEEVKSASCVGRIKRGVNAERECVLKNNIKISERIIAWNEGRSFTYDGSNIPLVAMARNTWSVKNENGKTLLTTESEIVMKGGIFGLLLEPVMYLMARHMTGKTLGAFKYLVENGRPYKGRYSTLPPVSPVC